MLDFVEEKGFLSSDVILLLGTVTHDKHLLLCNGRFLREERSGECLSTHKWDVGFVRQFAFSLFASGIQFTEIPRICLIFDHAFIECALDRGCLPVFGLKHSDPQNLIDNSIARTTGTLRA